MTRPRSQLVCIEETPYYHVTSRCVRHSFLCGSSHGSGKDYEHRRGWIEERLRILSSIFAIDICSYAVMSNHYHIVLKISPDESLNWSDDEVCRRWFMLFHGPLLMQMYAAGKPLNSAQLETVVSTIAVWRKRLTNLGWFMKCLNEPIARMANKEDGCTGHFWEARYKSQCLKTEHALLSCMAYVDLNPVRAKMAETPETSEHTSIKERIALSLGPQATTRQPITEGQLIKFENEVKPLLPFLSNINSTSNNDIPYSWEDYLTLVDWTGRMIQKDKRSYISADLPPILKRLNISPKRWLIHASAFEKYHARVFNCQASTLAGNICRDTF